MYSPMRKPKPLASATQTFAQMTVGTMWRLSEHELGDPNCPVSYLLIMESHPTEKKYVRCIPQYCGKEFFIHTLIPQDLDYSYRQATPDEWEQMYPHFVDHARKEMFAANEVARAKRSQFVQIEGFGKADESVWWEVVYAGAIATRESVQECLKFLERYVPAPSPDADAIYSAYTMMGAIKESGGFKCQGWEIRQRKPEAKVAIAPDFETAANP